MIVAECLVAQAMVVDKNRESTSSVPCQLVLTFADKALEAKIVRCQGQITHYTIRLPKTLLKEKADEPLAIEGRILGKKLQLSCNIPMSIDVSVVDVLVKEGNDD